MAKIVIELYDTENGGVDARASFDPQVDTTEVENLTNAQHLGLAMLSHVFPPDREDVTWSARNLDGVNDES